jgi:hypothetical protein
MSFKLASNLGEVDEAKTVEIIDRWAKRLLFDATRAALERVAFEFVSNGHIETGEAFGSIQPLGRAVRALMFAGGPKANVGASKSAYKFNTDFPVYEVVWETNVVHFVLSEIYSLTHWRSGEHISGTPWRFWDAAYETFDEYLRDHWLDNLPSLESFLAVEHLRVG